MKLLIIFVFGLAITVPATTVHGKRPESISNSQDARKILYQPRMDLQGEKGKITSCDGSLISPNYILTAAHCLENKVNATVYFGAISRYEGEAYRNVSRSDFIVHDGYNSSTRENDIALIKIPTVELTKNIQLVKLPKITEKQKFRNRIVLVTRWNKESKGASDVRTRQRQLIPLKVWSNKKCLDEFHNSPDIKESNMCASTHNLHACAGDGGGPVVLAKTKKQVAIISRSDERDCKIVLPSVFVRITEFLQWIKDNSDVKL